MVGGTLATSIYSNPIFPNLSRLIFQYVLSQSNLPMQCNPMSMLQASFKLLLPVQPTAHPLQQFGELMKMHRTTKYRAQYKYSCKLESSFTLRPLQPTEWKRKIANREQMLREAVTKSAWKTHFQPLHNEVKLSGFFYCCLPLSFQRQRQGQRQTPSEAAMSAHLRIA